MGCFLSSPSTLNDESNKNAELEKKMRQDYDNENDKIKLLLLGAGESGKTTIFRQMKILYGTGFNEEEITYFTENVHHNILLFMRAIIENGLKMRIIDESSSQSNEFKTILSAHSPFDPSVGAIVKSLWHSEPVQKTWARRSEFQIIDSHKAYLDDIDRISAVGYQAAQEDIVLCRIKTTGVVTTRYLIDGLTFEMYDVGGQRNERRKWIHCFDNTTAVIFVASLSEYDQLLLEDEKTNRVEEALQLFQDSCNDDHLRRAAIILFLNKEDLFRAKIQTIPIASIPQFSDYTGGSNFEAAWSYFLNLFLQRSTDPEREVFAKVTCATDASNIQTVFDSCKQKILSDNLKYTFG